MHINDMNYALKFNNNHINLNISDAGPGAKPVSHRDPRGGLGEL